MNQAAEDAITAMLNLFPQTGQNYDVLLSTLDKLCASLDDRAIIRAAERFAAGDVLQQSPKFAPSGPEFVQEARRQHELLAAVSRPRLPAPDYVRIPLSGRNEALRMKHQRREILAVDVSFEPWKQMSAQRSIPTGSSWVAALATVYGPEPTIQKR